MARTTIVMLRGHVDLWLVTSSWSRLHLPVQSKLWLRCDGVIIGHVLARTMQTSFCGRTGCGSGSRKPLNGLMIGGRGHRRQLRRSPGAFYYPSVTSIHGSIHVLALTGLFMPTYRALRQIVELLVLCSFTRVECSCYSHALPCC
jgi:hypothetical protein